jgi:hypothetical protein
MNIYLISQNYNKGDDTYDSAVVYAENESRAAQIHPNEDSHFSTSPYDCWAPCSDLVDVAYLGVAKEGAKEGVVCASFNAG